MPVTITGGKYASAALSAVGTTTVTVSTTPFVSGDFANTPRIVGLWNSAGTTFKGVAWVRRWLSTSQLELERAFIDPKDGSAVTQVVGDTVLVSKKWSEVATAGIAVDQDRVSVTDTITWGTSGSSNSLCFYDEGMHVRFSTGGAVTHNTFVGGLLVQGHLNDYAAKDTYSGCIWNLTSSAAGPVLGVAKSSAANVLFFGGQLANVNASAQYSFFGGYDGSSGETDYNRFLLMKTQVIGIDVISRNVGGNWTVPANHVIDSCQFISFSVSLSMIVRWGNGINSNCSYKIPFFSSNPIAIYGSDTNGTYDIGAPASLRSVVADIGDNNTLWRNGAGNGVQTVNITNVISTDYRAGFQTNPESNAQTNCTINVYFSDNFTNLIASSVLAMVRNSTWVADATATASGSVAALTAFWKTGTGHTLGASRGPWTARVRRYGYDEIEAAVTEAAYSLGSAGSATNISFGGLTNQIARPTLTAQANEATALAYAGISVTDHGASPVSWNGGTFSITITGDRAANPSLTAAQIWAHVKARIASLSSWGGKAGYLWHVLIDENPSGAGYVSFRGSSGGAGAALKGVRVVDQAGNPFPGVLRHQDDSGADIAVTRATLLISGLVSGARYRVERADNGALIGDGTASGSTASIEYTHSGSDIAAVVRARKSSAAPKYLPAEQTVTLTNAGASVALTLTADPIAS